MNKRLKIFLLWGFNGAFLLGTCGTLETVILQFSIKSLLHFAIVGLLWGLTSILIVIGLYDAVPHNKEPKKTIRENLGDMLIEGNLIECWLATYPIGKPDKIIYQPYMFFTDREYTHDELTEIMKTVHQKFILDKETGHMIVDFKDLNRQLNKYGVGGFAAMRRYYFDPEANESPENPDAEKETEFDEEKYLKDILDGGNAIYTILGEKYTIEMFNENQILGSTDEGSFSKFFECKLDGTEFAWYTFSAFGEEKYRNIKGKEEAFVKAINTYLTEHGYSHQIVTLVEMKHIREHGYGGLTEGELEYLRDCT